MAQKLLAYDLQDQGLDTIDTSLGCDHLIDTRRYQAAAEILKKFFELADTQQSSGTADSTQVEH